MRETLRHQYWEGSVRQLGRLPCPIVSPSDLDEDALSLKQSQVGVADVSHLPLNRFTDHVISESTSCADPPRTGRATLQTSSRLESSGLIQVQTQRTSGGRKIRWTIRNPGVNRLVSQLAHEDLSRRSLAIGVA